MIESSLEINFICENLVSTDITEYAEAIDENDLASYKIRDGNRLALSGRLIGSVMTIKEPSNHLYDISDNIITISIKYERFTRPDGRDRLSSLLSFVADFNESVGFNYVFGSHELRIERIGIPGDGALPSPISDEGLDRNQIDHPTSVMLFPPVMVEQYGKEWLLDLPADRAEELKHGSVFVVATEDITDFEQDTELHQHINDAMKPIEEAFANRDD